MYNGHFPGKLYPILDQNCLIFNTQSQTKLAENHTLHIGTYTYIAYSQNA